MQYKYCESFYLFSYQTFFTPPRNKVGDFFFYKGLYSLDEASH